MECIERIISPAVIQLKLENIKLIFIVLDQIQIIFACFTPTNM